MQMQQMVMINSSPRDAYRRHDIMTASSIDLVVMLYDALKKNIILGGRAIGKKDIEAAHKHLMKAQDIVAELIKSLDMSYEISGELLPIYEFILSGLGDANIRKDAQPLGAIADIVDELRSAWHEISKSNKGNLHISEAQA